MLLEEYFKPHQEEITKVDDKHGTENILPKAEILKNSHPPFQVKPLEQIPYFLKKEKLELSHNRAPLMIYKYRPAPDEKKRTRERPTCEFSTKVLSQ